MISLNFYQVCEELIGINAGQSFHDNYSGILIRPITNNSPGYTQYEQLRKGRFAFLKNAWDSLSSVEIATFTAITGTANAAMRLFLNANINLILSGNSMISSYPGSSSPASFPVSITSITNASFLIKASSGPIVPADHSLLILATACKSPSKIFTDPPQYSPIVSFPAGTDLTADTDIINDWKSYFGETTLGKRICIKAVLIDITNGTRGSASFYCQDVTAPIIPFYQGIDFRNTADYVTDPPGHDYEIVAFATNYPRVTPQGNTVGWTSKATNVRNNCNTSVPEIAGAIVTYNNRPNAVYRIDLPRTGIFKIRVAIGSCWIMRPSYSFWDDTTLIAAFSGTITFTNQFRDAGGTVRTRADWPSLNTQISYNFSSQIFLLKLGPFTPDGDNSAVSCLIIED